MAKCEACDGSGRVERGGWDGRPFVACSECDGTGNYKGREHTLGLDIERLREKCRTLEQSVNADSKRLVDQQRQIERLRPYETAVVEALRGSGDDPETTDPHIWIDAVLAEKQKLRDHFERFAGFVATTRRENTYEWMRLLLDWLNGEMIRVRLDPETWFDLVGADHFVLRRTETFDENPKEPPSGKHHG